MHMGVGRDSGRLVTAHGAKGFLEVSTGVLCSKGL